MPTILEYFRVLGLNPDASIDSIKRAYRQKAKELHPDLNNNPDAHEKFIFLTEAYEYLTGQRKIKFERYSNYYEDWESQSRTKARQRAREHARMKYEEFKKTDYYKNSQAALTVFEHFYFFSSIIILLSPVWGFLINSWNGFFRGLVLSFFSAPYWAGAFQDKIKIDLRSLGKSAVLIVQIKSVQYTILTLVNCVALFRYTLNTQITTITLMLILISLYGLSILGYWKKISVFKDITKTGLLLCVVPSAFNLFFLINYTFASKPFIETYSFVHEKRMYGERLTRQNTNTSEHLEKISYIDLEDNKYEDYHWFRMFFDFESMQDKHEITYTFETGIFGIRVLKDYSFN